MNCTEENFHLEIGRLSGKTVMTSLLETLLLEVRLLDELRQPPAMNGGK